MVKVKVSEREARSVECPQKECYVGWYGHVTRSTGHSTRTVRASVDV